MSVHRFLTLLLFLGVVAGLISGRFIHVGHAEETLGACHEIKIECYNHSDASDTSGNCHQHACPHSIPPFIGGSAPAFAFGSQLLGTLPATPVLSLDSRQDEPETPPLI